MNNKVVWSVIAAVVILVVVGVVVSNTKDKAPASVGGNNEQATSTAGAATTTAGAPAAGTGGTGTPAVRPTSISLVSVGLSYGDAVKKYGNSRMQFQPDCGTEQTSMTFKAGNQLMLDNRAGVSRTISLGGAKYAIPAYSYKVVALYAPAYPAKILVDCGAQQNVATITIQK